jgi:hypothetical protein
LNAAHWDAGQGNICRASARFAPASPPTGPAPETPPEDAAAATAAFANAMASFVRGAISDEVIAA